MRWEFLIGRVLFSIFALLVAYLFGLFLRALAEFIPWESFIAHLVRGAVGLGVAAFFVGLLLFLSLPLKE